MPAAPMQRRSRFRCLIPLAAAPRSRFHSISPTRVDQSPFRSIPTYTLTTSDSTQADRIGRDSQPSTCSGKASPGGGFPGTHYYKTWTFTHTSGAARCYTVTINAALGGPADIESVAYDQVYDPTMIDTNYLGDSGIVGLGTSVDKDRKSK